MITVAPVFCLLTCLAAARVDAQYVATHRVGIRLAAAPIMTHLTQGVHLNAQRNPLPSVALRTASAAVGWVAGAVAGGFVGYRVLPHSACSCDDPGLSEALTGAVVFGAVGAALGAAAPLLESSCSFNTRVGRSLIGSVVGTGLGFLAQSQSAQAVAIPVLSISGASLAEWRCS